ncbi:cytochrome c3 family protein [Desulfitobacterium chlororespirans]|nr:cytochrome c3 family protein [Desulfitobacterium chlororespirans]
MMALIIMFLVIGVMAGCSNTADTPPQTADSAQTPGPPTTGEPTAPATDTKDWWTPDMDCALCHSSNVESMQNTKLTISVHAQEGQNCVDCHGLATLQEAHQGATTVPGNITVRMPKEMCFQCHGSYEELAALTADSTVLPKKDGGYANPHVRPNENHDADVECYKCHKMHKEYDNRAECLSCHHTGELTCYTCH